MKFRRPQSPFWLVGIFAVIMAGLWLYEALIDHQKYKALTNGERIERIELKSLNDTSKHISILNDTVLSQINQAFQYFREFEPINPKEKTGYIQMDIYKKKKWTLEFLKTTHSGWATEIFTNWYQNDSVIAVLERYSILNSLQ